ncbi:MAG: nucleotidyltransferase domain-containing protein [Candidatus Korarchaeota archaeon]|nr:nucleotidyltransferase domain-containing protein [Candidatus Korarchaeota archaeon]
MSHSLLVKEALRKKEIFKNLDKYLRRVKRVIKSLDENAEVYLFGSVATGESLYSSDIDILVITELEPQVIIEELWKEGIGDPFEVHVYPPEYLPRFRRRANLKKL